VLKHLQSTEQSQSGLRTHRRSSCFARLVDVQHATSSTFKDMKVGQVPKSRRCASEPHNLSAAWANRRPWRIFTRVFVAHGRKRPLNRNVVQSRPATALAHQCGNGELTNEQKNCYRIRVFGDDRHTDDLYRQRYTKGVLVLCESGVVSSPMTSWPHSTSGGWSFFHKRDTKEGDASRAALCYPFLVGLGVPLATQR